MMNFITLTLESIELLNITVFYSSYVDTRGIRVVKTFKRENSEYYFFDTSGETWEGDINLKNYVQHTNAKFYIIEDEEEHDSTN